MSRSTLQAPGRQRVRKQVAPPNGKTRKQRPPVDPSGLKQPDRLMAAATLTSVADNIRLAVGVFLAFQDSEASSAGDIEEALELSPEERAAEITRLEEALRKAQEELDELNQDLPANETTAKAKEANIAEIERELFALKTAQAVVSRFPSGRTPDDWRMLLRDSIKAGQRAGFELLLEILLLPSLGAGLIRGVSAIRSVRGFFSWLFRTKPANRPRGIPWNEYGEGYARRFDRVKRAVMKPDEDLDLDECERAIDELEEWTDGYFPFSPGSPLR
ncbi:MAG: hypothetical protein ACT4P6_03450 [Gemmatimonadaceae bacterium]